MKETFNGKVTMCCTTDSSKYRVQKGEESYLEVEFNVEPGNPDNVDSFLIYSPEYKCRADLVGKEVRIVVEIDE